MKKLGIASLFLALLFSCETQTTDTCSDGIQNGTETGVDCGGDCEPCQPFNLEGHAQKGPFLNGSSVLITALDGSLNQIGTTYNTQILDNSGYFFSNGLVLTSPYVTLRADGFYFNEVCGKPSSAQITLNAITQLSNASIVNVKTLTHLEKSRVEYLVASGTSFFSAKEQALKEILYAFSVDTSNSFPNAEAMSISLSSDADAVLIAITSILQGYRSESEFSDLMANIVTDLHTDGVLNSTSIQSDLMAHAKILDTNEIKQNIIDRYNDLGISVNVPNFGKHVQNFVNNSGYTATETVIEYPEFGLNGKNILNTVDSVFNQYDYYSVTANRPNDCMSLKLELEKVTGSCQFGCWFYSISSVQNWNIGSYDQNTDTQTLISTGLETDLELGFETGTYKLKIYLNDSPVPSRVKMITVN